MSEFLNPYEYSAEGQRLVQKLESLDYPLKEANLLEAWKKGGASLKAVLEGFYYLITLAVAGRESQKREPAVELNGDFIFEMIKEMKHQKQYFGYDSGNEFFLALDAVQPSVFKNPPQVHAGVATHFPRLGLGGPQFEFPDQYDESVESKCKELCQKTQAAYNEVTRVLPVMKNSTKIRERFEKRDKDITMMDVKLAKETFEESRQVYVVQAKVIADGMPYVYQAHKTFPEVMTLHQVYNLYMAKLLASREAKGEVEKYIRTLAEPDFVWELPGFTPSDYQKERGVTPEQLQEKYREELVLVSRRLESRYRKRKLMAQLKNGTPKHSIIKDLMEILDLDQDDIRTHILLARLTSEHSLTLTNHVKRVAMREKALGYCESAFSKIDTYMDLQGVEEIKERDRMRVGFVKTISEIRIPMVRGQRR